MAIKKTGGAPHTMINSDIETRDKLKLAAAKLGLPMYALLARLADYALSLRSESDISLHRKNQDA